MKLLKYKMLLLIVVTLLITSCTKTSSDIRTASFMPTRVELQQTMENYEFLGDVDVDVDYSRYLFFFNIVHTINGKPASKDRDVLIFHGKKNIPITFDRQLRRAIYKALKEFPDADILMPVLITKQVGYMFLRAKIKKTAKIKAYKLKH